MTRLILAAAFACVALTSAHADTLPNFYLGTWCSDVGSETWERPEPSQACPSKIEIKSDRYVGENYHCRFLSIARGRAWPRATKEPKSAWIPEVSIYASCQDAGNEIRTVLKFSVSKGDYLVITDNSR